MFEGGKKEEEIFSLCRQNVGFEIFNGALT
jgi:hypothetical protein